MRKQIPILLVLLSLGLGLAASPNKALLIATSNPGASVPLYKSPKLAELETLLKDKHKFEVTSLENKSMNDLTRECKKFTDGINKGDVVFVYMVGYGIQEGKKAMYITHDNQKWDIQDKLIGPIARSSSEYGMANLAPVVVYDLLYQNAILPDSPPMERILVDPDIFAVLYSHTPGKNAGRQDSPIIFQLCKQLGKDNLVTLRGLLANVAEEIASDEQKPVLEGDTAFDIFLNPLGSPSKEARVRAPQVTTTPGAGPGVVALPETWKDRLNRYKSQPEAYLVGVGALGGLGGSLYFIISGIKNSLSNPDELPDPPGPPNN